MNLSQLWNFKIGGSFDGTYEFLLVQFIVMLVVGFLLYRVGFTEGKKKGKGDPS
nr:hypothetical protein BHI3_07840 [Bacteriovorax sp. HI3]